MDNQFVSESYIRQSLNRTENLIKEISSSSVYINSVIEACETLINAMKNGRFVLLAGNGGSAAQSQHFAAELISRFNFDRNPLPAIALTTDSSVVTAISNDYGYESVFERQIEGLAKSGDVFIGCSTSGNSPNIIKAFHKAKEMGLETIAMCGSMGIKSFKANIEISIPSEKTPLIQEMHLLTSHLLCDMLEKSIFNSRI